VLLSRHCPETWFDGRISASQNRHSRTLDISEHSIVRSSFPSQTLDFSNIRSVELLIPGAILPRIGANARDRTR
jgi:hypothetical protein